MLELFLVFALIVSCARAVRLRHGWAMLAGGVVAYLLVADLLAACSSGAQGGVFGFFGAAFIGPGASPLRAATAVPLPRLLLAQPLLLRGLRSCVCWLASWVCLRQSSQLNPLLARAYALDDIAMAFAGAGIVDALAAVVLLWARLMIGDDAAWLPRN